MAQAIIFISYHPQYLVDYAAMCKIDGNRSQHVLVICKHAYVNDAVINEFSGKFDHVVVLPDIEYDKNMLAGILAIKKFKKMYTQKLAPILRSLDSYRIVSCCSAWPAVNVLLTGLCHTPKCKSLVTVCEHIASRGKINYPRTLLVLLYTLLFGLRLTSSDKIQGYLYHTHPWDGVLRLVGPYDKIPESSPADAKTRAGYFRRRAKPKRLNSLPGIVVFYSDRDLGAYKSSLAQDDRRRKLEQFMQRFGEFYHAHTIVCKPHPLDNGIPVDQMKLIPFTLCDLSLLTQVHLQLNLDRIVACYSISSTSLVYSASIGIPSYSLYKYMGYGDDANMKICFDSPKARQDPFLYAISALEEIGKIDDIEVKPLQDNNAAHWERILYAGTPLGVRII